MLPLLATNRTQLSVAYRILKSFFICRAADNGLFGAGRKFFSTSSLSTDSGLLVPTIPRTTHSMLSIRRFGAVGPCLLVSSGAASRLFYGGQPYTARPLTGAVPLCHFVTFPPHSGGIFPLSLRDISPTPWGNLPAPPQGLRCPLRSAPCLCATGAQRPFVKGGRKL